MPKPFPIDHWGNDLTGFPYYQSGLGMGAIAGGTNPLGISMSRLVKSTVNPNVDFLGNGTSYRMLLHEFGHIFLWDRIHTSNFTFAHSFGDTLAALLNDPVSLMPETVPQSDYDRYNTFPWDFSGNTTNPDNARRHGRNIAGPSATAGSLPFHTASGGWYWGGYWDVGGYQSEQILSSTFFDAYKSLGGDDPVSQSHKEFAAQMLVLLILKTVKNYSGTASSNNAAQAAMDFSEDIVANDKGYISTNYPLSLPFNNTAIPLGASHKVIRWAFEKRGAYYFSAQVPPSTNYDPAPFPPQAVDVYIDDGRAGEYQYQTNFWSAPAIFNRIQADGTLTTPHQNPDPGSTNYLYVKIKSRGQAWPTHLITKAYMCGPGGGNVWPQDWTPVSTTQIVTIVPPFASEILVGPFDWQAALNLNHVCFLVAVSSAAIGTIGQLFITEDDKANTESITATIPDWHLIPNDNNIAQRNMSAVSAAEGSMHLPVAIGALGFGVKNPYNDPILVTLEVTLPELMKSKGWGIGFDTGNEISLEAFDREGVFVTPEVTEGEAFTRDEVLETEDRNIVIYMNTEYGCIGGMTYYLDPDFGEG